MKSKNQIRKMAKNFRKFILTDFKRESERAIVRYLCTLDEVLHAEHLMYYSAMEKNGEINVSAVKEKLTCTFYLPKVISKTQMHCIAETEQFEISSFGIKEPLGGKSEVCPDVILVPALAFDFEGNRVGYGAGYYDRFLDALSENCNPILIGISYSQLILDRIPAESHDIKMKYVVTEQGIVRI